LGHFSWVAASSAASAFHIEHFTPNFVRGQKAGSQAHRARHELAAVDAELPRFLAGDLADPVLHFLLLVALPPRDVFLVRDKLRWHGRINALQTIALSFTNPHGECPFSGG
jgi:hypothetical protein